MPFLFRRPGGIRGFDRRYWIDGTVAGTESDGTESIGIPGFVDSAVLGAAAGLVVEVWFANICYSLGDMPVFRSGCRRCIRNRERDVGAGRDLGIDNFARSGAFLAVFLS